MRKTFFLYLCMLADVACIQSQHISAGISAGMNINLIKGTTNPRPQYSLSSGVFLLYREQYLSLQAGLFYTYKGARMQSIADSFSVSEEHNLHLQYLEMPIQAGFRLFSYAAHDTALFRPKLLLGGFFSILTNASQNVSVTKTGPRDKSTNTGIRNDFKYFDSGIALTGGVNWRITDSSRLSFDAGYRLGLININGKRNSQEILKNRNFSFLLGITTRLSKEE